MISIVGVFHVGHRSQRIIMEGQTRPWRKLYLLPPLKQTNKKTNTCNNSRASAASLWLLYSIMHELTGVHFVLAGVKPGPQGVIRTPCTLCWTPTTAPLMGGDARRERMLSDSWNIQRAQYVLSCLYFIKTYLTSQDNPKCYATKLWEQYQGDIKVTSNERKAEFSSAFTHVPSQTAASLSRRGWLPW